MGADAIKLFPASGGIGSALTAPGTGAAVSDLLRRLAAAR
jgi:hypothetical protein